MRSPRTLWLGLASVALVAAGAVVAWVTRPSGAVDAYVDAGPGGSAVPATLTVRGEVASGSLYRDGNAAKVLAAVRPLHAAGSRLIGVSIAERQMAVVAVTRAGETRTFTWRKGLMVGPVPGPAVARSEIGWRTIAFTDFEITDVERLHAELGDSSTILTVKRDPTTRKVTWIAHDAAGGQRVVGLAHARTAPER